MSNTDCNQSIGNQKFEVKMRDIEGLFEVIHSNGSITAPPNIEKLLLSYLETYSKELSPHLVQRILDTMLLYLNKFDFKQIPVSTYVNYMIYNSTAKVKCRDLCYAIFKKMYMLVPNELLSNLSDVISSHKVVFVLHTIEIVKFLLTLKQFGPIQKRFAEFASLCIPHLLKYISDTSNANLKRGCLDLLSDLVKEFGNSNINQYLSTISYQLAIALKEEIEKKLSIKIIFEQEKQPQVEQKQTQVKFSDITSTCSTSIRTPPISPVQQSRQKDLSLDSKQNRQQCMQTTVTVAQEVAREYLKKLEIKRLNEDENQRLPSVKTQIEHQLQIVNKLQVQEERPLGKNQLLEQKRRQIELDRIKQELSFIQNVVYQDYNKFSTKNNKEKFILIDTLYQNLTNGSIKLGETPVSANTLVEFFRFENTKGIQLSIKILKIFLMVQENSMEKMKAFFQSTMQDILVAAIKNISVSRRVLLYQVISLFQMIYELKAFNTELLSSFFVSLISDQTKTQRNALEILSNFVMRNQITTDTLFHQILSETAELASTSPKSQIRAFALQILIQAQQQIGDQINHYIGRLRFCQLRSFKKATQPIQSNSQELNLKEKSKCCEIETMICQEFLKNEDMLIKLINNEIDFYNKRQQCEFSLNYVKIFSTLLQKPSKFVVKNSLYIFSHIFKQFKPSEILTLFDVIINIKYCLDPSLHRMVLVQLIQHHGFSMFYSKIIEYLQQKRFASNLVSILRFLINEINDMMMTEIIENTLKLIDENQIELNNLIYHFLALACISRGEQHVENIIRDKYFFSDHLLKKVQREKEKCLYLIHLAQKNKQTSTTLSNAQQSQNFELINFDLDFDSFICQNQEEIQKKFLNQDNSKIMNQNLEDESDTYSFVEAQEDEI